MRPKHRACILLVALAHAPASAEVVNDHVFHYHGGPISHLRAAMDRPSPDGGSYWTAYWNPDNRITHTGFHVSFWGSGTGCARVANGAVAVESAGNHALTFTPSGRGVAGCRVGAQAGRGISHVRVDEAAEHGEIALYTHAGPRPDSDVPAFFQPFPEAGQNGKGDNRNIVGSFVAFRFGPPGRSMKPWSGKAESGDRRLRVAIRTQQSVSRLPGDLSDDRKVTQLKQQVAVTFANRHCLAHRRAGQICQINFMMHTASWQDIRRPRHEKATLMFDPVQGGLPVVYGPLRASSRATVLDGNEDAPAWISWGEPTKSAPFPTSRFQAEISFVDFIGILRVVASRQRLHDAHAGPEKVAPASTTDGDVAKLFGDAFRSPAEWYLLDAHFAQEVHSPNPRDRAYIEGAMTELYVAALPR